MDPKATQRTLIQRVLNAWNHPLANVALIAWGLCLAMFVSTATGDAYKIAKGGQIVLLALGRLLIARQIRWFFWGLLAVGLALPLGALSTAGLFHGGGLVPDIDLTEAAKMLAIVGVASVPVWLVALWGLRWSAANPAPSGDDPPWVGRLDKLFKWTLLVMFLSFHLVAAPLLVFGALVFTVGMTALAAQRLRLTRAQVGALWALAGIAAGATAFVALMSMGGRVSLCEASWALVAGGGVACVGFAIWLTAQDDDEVFPTPPSDGDPAP